MVVLPSSGVRTTLAAALYNELVTQIQPHPNSCQYPLINYLVLPSAIQNSVKLWPLNVLVLALVKNHLRSQMEKLWLLQQLRD